MKKASLQPFLVLLSNLGLCIMEITAGDRRTYKIIHKLNSFSTVLKHYRANIDNEIFYDILCDNRIKRGSFFKGIYAYTNNIDRCQLRFIINNNKKALIERLDLLIYIIDSIHYS